MRGSLRIGRLLGIPIGIQPLWLVIVGLITWSLGSSYFPAEVPGIGTTAAYALGLAGALGLFAGILLHELGHAVVARRHGIHVEEIDLWLLGGVARLEGEAERPDDELRFAAAGPAVTAAIAAVLGALRLALDGVAPSWAIALIDYELYVSAAILGFNLLPAFPLDGGRICRALLWRRSGDRRRATATAAALGRGFGWGFVALGGIAFFSGVLGGMWFALIGWFLIVAGAAESQLTAASAVLGNRTAGDLMSAPAVTLSEHLTTAEAVTSGFTHHLFSSFPVVDEEGRAIGLVTQRDVRLVPATARTTTSIAAIAHREPGLLIGPDEPAARLLAEPDFRRWGRAVVVDPARHPLGVVSVSDIERRLKAEELLPG